MYAGEYTPEITDAFRNRLALGISQRGGQAVGQARGEALSRGLEGDQFERSAVTGARDQTSNEMANLDAQMAYGNAGLQREERLTSEGRTYGSAEAQKQRDFQQKMAEQEFQWRQQASRESHDWQRDDMNTANRQAYQAAIWQIPTKGLFQVAGAFAGGK